MERRLRHPARTRRVLRRTCPLVMPNRRLPYLRDDAHRGDVDYSPDPVEPPVQGSVFISCSRPRDDIVLDL